MANVSRCDLYLRDVETDSVTFTAYKDDGTIQDLTGWTASAKVRLTRATVATILVLTSPIDIVITAGAVAGNVVVNWTVASKTTIRAALLDTVGAWGLHLTDAASLAHVEIEGDISVGLSVGR